MVGLGFGDAASGEVGVADGLDALAAVGQHDPVTQAGQRRIDDGPAVGVQAPVRLQLDLVHDVSLGDKTAFFAFVKSSWGPA